MGKIKSAGVCAGIVIGGLIGGTVSLIGKMTEKKVIDELGESIMDSTILTGEIVGEVASGATHVVSGAIRKKPRSIQKGKNELGSAGGRVVGNVVTNVKMVAGQSGEILEGVKEGDQKRVANGFRTLGKMAVIGMLTVGAIKVDEIAEQEPAPNPAPDTAPQSAPNPVPQSAPNPVPDTVVSEAGGDSDAAEPAQEEEVTMESLLSKQATLEEELEEKIRF